MSQYYSNLTLDSQYIFSLPQESNKVDYICSRFFLTIHLLLILYHYDSTLIPSEWLEPRCHVLTKKQTLK